MNAEYVGICALEVFMLSFEKSVAINFKKLGYVMASCQMMSVVDEQMWPTVLCMYVCSKFCLTLNERAKVQQHKTLHRMISAFHIFIMKDKLI